MHNLKTFDDYAQNAADKLEQMQINDPASFERLLSAKINMVRLSGKIAVDVNSPMETNHQSYPTVATQSFVPVVTDLKTYDDFALNAPDRLEQMQQNDPASFQRLLYAKINLVRMSGLIAKD